MALRNQPYFPLYVQDYLTDENLNLCSWQTQGIYIKILCVLHKQKNYGSILFKQNSKQNKNFVLYFASVFVRNIPCQLNDMINALNELLENEVLIIKDEKLYQKRMYKDGEISQARSKAGKKGGGNPNLFKQSSKQNTEYEYENENENKEVIKGKDSVKGKPKIEIPDYSEFKNYALEKKPDIDLETLRLKYESWVENDWQTGTDKPREIKNWKTTLLNTLPYIKNQINGKTEPTINRQTRSTIESNSRGWEID